MSKHKQLLDLASKRQRTRWDGYACIADVHSGVYECNYVSPYTKSANNVDASIMVLLQDWSSYSRLFNKPIDEDSRDLGHSRNFPTNRNLKTLLSETFGMDLKDTYATNLFPFIKPGGISSKIFRIDLVRAALEFAIPQIEIVSPRLVICLGLETFNAVRIASNYKASPNLSVALENSFLVSGSSVWCQAHTGARGQNTRNSANKQQSSEDWKRMQSIVGKKV